MLFAETVAETGFRFTDRHWLILLFVACAALALWVLKQRKDAGLPPFKPKASPQTFAARQREDFSEEVRPHHRPGMSEAQVQAMIERTFNVPREDPNQKAADQTHTLAQLAIENPDQREKLIPIIDAMAAKAAGVAKKA